MVWTGRTLAVFLYTLFPLIDKNGNVAMSKSTNGKIGWGCVQKQRLNEPVLQNRG